MKNIRPKIIKGFILLIVIVTVIFRGKIISELRVLLPSKYLEFVELEYVLFFDKTKSYSTVKAANPSHFSEFVAHAGGAIKGLTYTNSFESLEWNYKNGYRFFEIDINWTSDNQLVLIHDWEDSVIRLFGVPPRIYNLHDFIHLKSLYGLKQMTLDDLILWLIKHDDACIVTDCKKNTLETLELISKNVPEILDRVIPQIYRFTEYNKVRRLGFRTVILTLYVKNYSDNVLLKFLENYPVSAVTMPINRAMTNLPSKVNKLGIFVYTHTVNEKELMSKLKANGVNGVYTDHLITDEKNCSE